MRNIELKARLCDRRAAEAALERLGAQWVWTGRQADTFFAVAEGWLKLRESEGLAPQVISYNRAADVSGPRPSDYDVLAVADPGSWKRLLGRVLPLLGEVHKERTLWAHGHTRVHLDRVEGLGEFVELETVVAGIDEPEARAEAAALAAALSIEPADLIAVPYLELLRRGGG